MNALYYFVIFLARILNLAILIRVFLSWLPISHDSRFVHIVLELTEPILGPIRRVMPSLGGLDLSPMVGLIVIQVAERVLLSMVARLG